MKVALKVIQRGKEETGTKIKIKTTNLNSHKGLRSSTSGMSRNVLGNPKSSHTPLPGLSLLFLCAFLWSVVPGSVCAWGSKRTIRVQAAQGGTQAPCHTVERCTDVGISSGTGGAASLKALKTHGTLQSFEKDSLHCQRHSGGWF